MSIQSIEFNFSSSGGEHQATITDITSDIVCGGPISSSGGGENFRTSNAEINKLLNSFLVEEETKQIDARTEKKIYKMVDKTSAILRRTAVLVRGVTAPITKPDSGSSSIIFASSQHPKSFYKQSFAGQHGIFTSEKYNGYVVLGSSYSRFSGESPAWDNNAKKYKIEKSEFFYQNSIKIEDLSYGPDFEYGEKDASIASGYTADELISCIRTYGITVNGAIPNGKAALFTEAGTLANCLSEVCNFYGYYWYIEPFNQSPTIKLIESSEANKQIPDPISPADNILSFSETTSYKTKHQVLSFFGTSDNPIKTLSASYGGGASKKKFMLIGKNKPESLYEKNGSFFTFFKIAEILSKEAFDVLFYAAFYKGEKFNFKNTGLSFEFGDKKSGALKDLFNLTNEEYQIQFENFKKSVNRPDLNSNTAFGYKLRGGEMPSEKMFEYFETCYNLYGKFFISRKHSEKSTKKYSYQGGEGVSVSKAYHESTNIEDITELSPFLKVGLIKKGTTIKQISEKWGYEANSNQAGDPEPILGEGYYYIAVLQDITKGDESDTKKNNPEIADEKDRIKYIKSIEKDSFRLMQSLFIKDQCSVMVFKNSGVPDIIHGLLKKSKEQYEKYIEESKRYVTCFKQPIEDSNQNSSGQDVPVPNSVFINCIISQTGNFDKTSEAEIVSFTGTPEEVKTFKKHIAGSGFDIKTTSTTYAGLVIPSSTIGISSMSINFSDQGVSTTIERSNLPLIPQNRDLILQGKTVKNFSTNTFGAGTKNYFGLT